MTEITTHKMNELCAGLLVYRYIDDRLQFLLSHPANNKNQIYAIAKGHLETGETKLKAAIRETLEETGVRAKPIVELPSIHYELKRSKSTKTVTFFLAEYISGVDEDGNAIAHDKENDVVKFFDADNLPSIFNTQKPVIESAIKYLERKQT